MTLSGHSESIQKSIQNGWKELSGELQQNQGWDSFSLFSWLESFNFRPWVKHIVGLAIMGLSSTSDDYVMFAMCLFLYSTAYQSEHKAGNAYADTHCIHFAMLVNKREGGVGQENTECLAIREQSLLG